MLGQIFSRIGGALGNLMGGGMISTVMRFAGRNIGNYLERNDFDPEEYYHTKYHINNLHINANTNGKAIALIFGKARLAGYIIWATPIEEVAVNTTDVRYFRNSGDVKAIHHNTNYLYYANFAMALCEGVVSDIQRIWVNGIEADLSEYTYRFYNGTEEQMPDPLIEKSMGNGRTPAHRGIAYIVFEKFPLADFGGRIPGLSFELIRKPNIQETYSFENKIKSMVMIPGSGEFVYDTICQDKVVYAYPDNVELYRDPINYHNKQKIADSIYSLNALQEACPSLEWVAPVVTWFCDSTDAGEANIFPAVEYNDLSSKTTEEWHVASFTRENARIISTNELGAPNYGGTVNDESLVRYLQEIKKRGLKTMLYPMIFLDIPGKPWRGHITSIPEGVRRFFNHDEGYKNFILHYVHLSCGLVDAFIIGSEMKGLTKVMESDNRFPAVEELVDLARKVKEILGPNVAVSYAADWSEYHHTDGGFFHMDQLWACEAIDFIGIDAYFPLTDSTSSDISYEDIKKGWQSGEGYDYYIDHATGERHVLGPEWAWKNIEYWWKNHHTNANGIRTSWIPRSKKIWFTEFGFPSIDKASNQPNVFFDPNSIDGGVPNYSTGEVDFAIQKKSIKATLDFWKDSEFLERMFLWTWDARPYPAWPHANVWADGYMWLRGHWVNGKLGVSNLASILLELCARGGIKQDKINVDTIDEAISGLVLTKQSSIWDIISILRLGYFFDVRSDYLGKVDFVKRGSYKAININAGDLVNKNSLIEITDIAEDHTLAEIIISFPDEGHEYCYNIVRTAIEKESNRSIYYLNLPILMDENAASNLANAIIHSARSEDKIFKFTVTIEYLLKICPGDVVVFEIYNRLYRIRITDIKYCGLLLDILGVFDHKGVGLKSIVTIPQVTNSAREDEYFEIFELPELMSGRLMGSIYAASSKKAALYVMLHDKTKVADLRVSNMGIVSTVMNNIHASSYIVDDISRFTIFSCSQMIEPSSYEAAMLGDELIYYKNLDKISDNLYMISSFIRGANFTDIVPHNVGERFTLMKNVSEIAVSNMLEKTNITFLAASKKYSLNFKGLNNYSIEPIEIISNRNDDRLELKWKGQMKNIDSWRDCRNDIEYKITHELNGILQEFYTKKNVFCLEGISADSKVGIVTMQKGFLPSEEVYILQQL